MEPIKLHINRLGRVANSDIEVTRMVIFSGESSMGKSYMAMLCHYFFEILLNTSRLTGFFKDKGLEFNRNNLKNVGTACVIEKSDLQQWMAKDVLGYLTYLLGHSIDGDVEVALPSCISERIEIKYEVQSAGLVDELETYVLLQSGHLTYKVKDNDAFDESPYSFILRHELTACLFGNFKDLKAAFVLPPSRGPLLTEDIIPRTGLYKEFQTKLRMLESPTTNQLAISEKLIGQVRKVMEGEVSRKNLMYVYNTHGVEMPVSAAASSIRELAPLEMISEKTEVKFDAVLMEEPEAHLHPEKQRGVADILATMYAEGASLQITTHSDYFLSRLNELILLGLLKHRLTAEDFKEACSFAQADEALALDSSEIRTYLIKRTEDGHSEVVVQQLNHGVSFASFSKAVRDNLTIGNRLEDLLTNE